MKTVLLISLPFLLFFLAVPVLADVGTDSLPGGLTEKYGGAQALSMASTVSLVDAEGNPITSVPARKGAFTFRRAAAGENPFRIDEEGLSLVFDGETLVIKLREEMLYGRYTVPSDGSLEDVLEGSSTLRLIVDKYPVRYFLENRRLPGTPVFEKAPDGQWRVFYGSSRPREIQFDATGSIAWMRLDSGGLPREWIQVTPESVLFTDEGIPDDAFSTRIPEGFTDLSDTLAGKTEPPRALSLVGGAAPAFELKSLSGETVHLDSYRGAVVVLDFWASWCPICLEGLPRLEEASARAGDGIVFLGMNLDQEGIEAARRLAAERAPSITHLQAAPVAREYQVDSVPMMVVVDPNGQVRDVHLGPVPKVAELLELKTPNSSVSNNP